jgi:predicted PurR-regulated permease PerM
MHKQAVQPFYQRLSYNLISLAIITLALIYGQDILLPLLFSVLLANLLRPVTNYLERKKLNRSLAIIIPLFLAIVVGVGILYFLSNKVVHFMEDVPLLKERVNEITDSAQQWFKKSTQITIRKQNQYLDDTMSDLKEKAPELVGQTFISLTAVLLYVVLLPLYTFLILYYRSNIKAFLISQFKNGSDKRVNEVLTESTSIAQQYLTGLLIETTLVFALNTIGFLILGIKYPVFLALLAALLNLIPYVGMITASVICMFVTLISSDSTTSVLWVGVILAVVQFLDNNFGMPLIVGTKVKINALVTIIGIFVGGALCGIPGMFLAIPALALFKVIFDKVPALNPWGMMLGDRLEGSESNESEKSTSK